VNPTLPRRLLVTAGPTWMPIDAVRHLANFSTGRMGATLARAAAAAGWGVTLLYGPGRHPATAEDERRMEVVPFTTFDDLHALLRERVGSRSYTGLVHAAAVSDYRPAAPAAGKLDSSAPELVLRLVRAPKLVDEVKRLDPEIVLVAFKLTANQTREEMVRSAQALRRRCGAELVVANDQATLTPERHPALLLAEEGVLAAAQTPGALAGPLLAEVARRGRR
jgi:phosphopantothenoylcysteine decarboxylase/phosphopantothenate--cysteine ligase